MRHRLPALLIAGLAAAAAHAEPDLENGRAIAMGGGPGGPQTACFTCHGAEGEGDRAAAFPRLAGQSGFYLYKQLQDYAYGHRPNEVMTPIARELSDSDMEDVAAYYAALTDVPYGEPGEADPELLQRGGQLSAIGSREQGIQACVNCHGPGGAGMAPSFPYLAGQHANYTELTLHQWKNRLRRNDPLGVMEEIVRRMSDEDIRAVALYFEQVRPGNAHPQPIIRNGLGEHER
ncbi:cytochrome c4 [Ectothiorhodospiraceae bacterium 2226]|nr:cytochrome c4 [Ectothiorhodospiraceae bacterium 2226]